MHFKTFVQVLMAVLALGISIPEPACAAGTAQPGKTCCCSGSPTCKCHPGQPCKQSCTLVQVHALDKQLPGKPALAASYSDVLLYWIAPTTIKYLVLVPVARERNVNVSPPFGGSPPQAMLRLWLI